ncbi:MAG: hypothetical protein K5898_16830 [Ruminococcus sp.]|uniref:hypothetical protein n=1 Tax=Ruminococcus sp. TaxID=41978 RepID=UPI0025E576B4|nr:hypothetical protein [Ruminococcus sp.]MCR4796803.1 hypothetical protein [Ruminococcus sp.]
MKKKTALLCALIMLLTTACGSMDNSSETDEEITTASEEETTAEAETEENTEVSDKLGAEFRIFPDISLGMTEEELQAVIGDDYGRKAEKFLDNGPELIYYTVPFESVPYLDADMEGYEFFTFIPDGELISMGYNFGVKDKNDTPSKEHSEEEIKAVYDKLFEQVHKHYGDHYDSDDKQENCIGNVSWNNAFGYLNLSAFHYPDSGTGKVTLSVSGDDFMTKILAAAKEKTTVSDDLSESDIIAEDSLFSELNKGVTKSEAFSLIGKEPATSEERGSTSFYEWNFDKDDAFGTELPFSLYIEFNDGKDSILSYGYELGVQHVDGNIDYYDVRCDFDDIDRPFHNIAAKFKAVYGEPQNDSGETDNIYIWDNSGIVMFLMVTPRGENYPAEEQNNDTFMCIARSYE